MPCLRNWQRARSRPVRRIIFHPLSPHVPRQDAFDEFLEDRRAPPNRLVETAIGNPVVQVPDGGDYEDRDE